jgi:N-acetyl-gamma-glutamyl-phosphate reductase / acetylglutamate kinase
VYDFANLDGLPELYSTRDAYKKPQNRISNPGCYATACQLGIVPLKPYINGVPSLFGVSGYSGAGTTPSRNNNPDILKDNIIPYKLTGHIHESEVSHHSGVDVAFIPHVGQFFSGISLTCNVPLTKSISSTEALEVFEKYYQNEPLVDVQAEIPEVKDISGKHNCIIGGFTAAPYRLVYVVNIDNLLKGAATQCLQNMNLALGMPETKGIFSAAS